MYTKEDCLADFLADLSMKIRQKMTNHIELQRIAEFYRQWQYENRENDDTDTDSDNDININVERQNSKSNSKSNTYMKYFFLGWYIYNNILPLRDAH
jgi:hypothetical protein